MPAKESYQAIVDKIVEDGRHGSYAVARSPELGIITFSLDIKVWQEEVVPEPGTCVMLSKLFKKRAGWRASSARFVTPSDDESTRETRNQHWSTE